MLKILSLLFRLLLIVLGGFLGSAVFIAIWYHTNDISDMPYDFCLSIVWIIFAFGLMFLVPHYIFLFYVFPHSRKAWAAFAVGVMWLPLHFINPIPFDSPDSVSLSFVSLFVTAFADCLIVVLVLWLINLYSGIRK